jgi:hypothetical protein
MREAAVIESDFDFGVACVEKSAQSPASDVPAAYLEANQESSTVLRAEMAAEYVDMV